MFRILVLLIKLILFAFGKSKQEILTELLIVQKENQLLKRRLDSGHKKIHLSHWDRLFYSALVGLFSKVKSIFILVKPETVLKWYRNFLKKRWIFPAKKKSAGRPATPKGIRDLICEMKNKNLLWGNKRIQGELMKIGISLDKKTIRNIIADLRCKGKIRQYLPWREFIKQHLDSLHAMDFFTVDSILGKRFYIFFIMYLKTREIIHFNITINPTKLFVNQQLLHWRWNREEEKVYLIHDNDPAFKNCYFRDYSIRNVVTSILAPNMNSYAERFVRSIRREALDNFIIFGRNQLQGILKKYIAYYNRQRPHQGIGQDVPAGYIRQTEGKAVSFPVLSGLHHHYERRKVS